MNEIMDVQILIRTPTCLLSQAKDLKVNILDIRGARDNVSHLVEVDKNLCGKLIHLVKEKDLKFTHSTYRGKSCIARISSDGCLVCKTLIDNGAFLISGNLLVNEMMSYRFIVASKKALEDIFNKLDSENIKYEVLSMKRLKKKGYLTARQEEILILSLRLGLFDYPRRIKSSEIASMLGIKTSTFTEILRRGIKKVLENVFY